MMQSVKHSTAEMGGAVVRGMSRFDSLNVLEQIQVERKQQPSARRHSENEREIVHRPSIPHKGRGKGVLFSDCQQTTTTISLCAPSVRPLVATCVGDQQSQQQQQPINTA